MGDRRSVNYDRVCLPRDHTGTEGYNNVIFPSILRMILEENKREPRQKENKTHKQIKNVSKRQQKYTQTSPSQGTYSNLIKLGQFKLVRKGTGTKTKTNKKPTICVCTICISFFKSICNPSTKIWIRGANLSVQCYAHDNEYLGIYWA